jgi:hypothetical protein
MNSTATKKQEAAWKVQRAANVDAYLSACANLSDAIIEYLPDFLSWRVSILARCTGRELGATAQAVIAAHAAPFRVSLREALGRIDWLAHVAWLRSHQPGRPPVELAPLEQLVEASLTALRTEWGIPLHPKGEWGAVYHQPLAGECWPDSVFVMETVAYGAQYGFPQKMEQLVRRSHPIHAAFRRVADAAQWVDTTAIREAPEATKV